MVNFSLHTHTHTRTHTHSHTLTHTHTHTLSYTHTHALNICDEVIPLPDARSSASYFISEETSSSIRRPVRGASAPPPASSAADPQQPQPQPLCPSITAHVPGRRKRTSGLSRIFKPRRRSEAATTDMPLRVVMQGPGPWGFRLVGGKHFEQPLAVSRVSLLSGGNAPGLVPTTPSAPGTRSTLAGGRAAAPPEPDPDRPVWVQRS